MDNQYVPITMNEDRMKNSLQKIAKTSAENPPDYAVDKGTKIVPLHNIELWPEKVVCFPAWTGTHAQYQERTYVLSELVERFSDENTKLREIGTTMLRELLTAGVFLREIGYSIAVDGDEAKKLIMRCAKLGIKVDDN